MSHRNLEGAMFRIITLLALRGSAVSGCTWTSDTIDKNGFGMEAAPIAARNHVA